MYFRSANGINEHNGGIHWVEGRAGGGESFQLPSIYFC